MSDDEASTVIARYMKGWRVRDVLSRFIANRYMRGIDSRTYREFFFDKMLKKSRWTKPVLLKDSHMKLLQTKVVDTSGKGKGKEAK